MYLRPLRLMLTLYSAISSNLKRREDRLRCCPTWSLAPNTPPGEHRRGPALELGDRHCNGVWVPRTLRDTGTLRQPGHLKPPLESAHNCGTRPQRGSHGKPRGQICVVLAYYQSCAYTQAACNSRVLCSNSSVQLLKPSFHSLKIIHNVGVAHSGHTTCLIHSTRDEERHNPSPNNRKDSIQS